jgi:predicted RNase H-like nuclease (RuvC/YqgF family)
MMSRTGEIREALAKFDEEGNPITIEEGSKTGASNAPTLEDLMKMLEKLTAENNKLRRKAKNKKIKGDSSSSEDEDSSLEEDVSKKGKKGRNNRDKSSYNSMSFNYDNIPSITAYTSIPVGKDPYFDGTCYNQ